MLVLSRKVGEQLWIGDKITVTVVRIAGGGVRIGIEAPDELPIMRAELRDSLSEQGGLESANFETPVSSPDKPLS